MASPTLELFCSGSRAEIALKHCPRWHVREVGMECGGGILPSRLKYLAKAKPLEIDGSLIPAALSYEGDWTAEKE